MKSSWMRWGIGTICVLVLCLFLIVLLYPFSGMVDYWLIKLPRTHDPRLVGTWKGSWQFFDDPVLRLKVTILRPDGTGEWSDGRTHLPFEWGTQSGVFYTRRMATDAWSGRRFPFQLRGTVVSFSETRIYDPVCATMHR